MLAPSILAFVLLHFVGLVASFKPPVWLPHLHKSRTHPPLGAYIVRQNIKPWPSAKLYDSIGSAVAALPNDTTNQTIFIYPGVYFERINITRTGPTTIYGYTKDVSNFAANQVRIEAGVPASVAGSNDLSGTLRVHKDDFRMYNVNVTNTWVGSQAIAISQYGSRVGLYACAFLGFQDTLYANLGTQVYLKSYIEGAVDFIFGRGGLAFFGGNTIGVRAAGYITASGRLSNDTGSYVFDHTKVITAPNAAANTTGRVFLGRPWGNFAKVIFKNTDIEAPLNNTLWSTWNPGDERTDNVFLAEYNTFGRGVPDPHRPSFSTLLTRDEATAYSISSAVGTDYAQWVDPHYLT
jgi:pectinesterase